MGFIRLRTGIPGPRSRALMKKKERALPSGIDCSVPVFIRRADGALVHDVDGNTLLDFSGGYGAMNMGHSNPAVVRAIRQQSKHFLHTCFFSTPYENYVQLCEVLNRITPGSFRKKTVLFNSGAEAVENAVKTARRYTGRQAVVSFEEGFHGRTLLTLSLTGKVKPYKFGFGPFAPETYKLHYPYLYRKPAHMEDDEYVDYLLEYLENDFFKTVVAPENIACVVIELVAGEGGFIVAPKRYIQKLARLCRQNGILLIVDEVQTGFGRTGKLFATEHYGIKPDMITMSKSLSGGMPLSAVTGRAAILDSVQEGGFGGTFSGNPVSCAAALASVGFILRKKLWQRAARIGRITMQRFQEFRDSYECVGDARGLGAMCGLEIVKDKKGKEPDRHRTHRITRYAYENGLVLLYAGIPGNDIRTLMPLTISDAQLQEGLNVIEKSIRASS